MPFPGSTQPSSWRHSMRVFAGKSGREQSNQNHLNQDAADMETAEPQATEARHPATFRQLRPTEARELSVRRR